MCGYDPFYWYEYDLDKEYLERTGDKRMHGFRQAQLEYERYLTSPFDKGGPLYGGNEEEITREDYLETQAEYMLEEMMMERYSD